MSNSIILSRPGKIMIRSTNWIGDAVMTTPAIRTIRENFPESTISILAHPWVADVFAASPYIDEVIIYRKHGRHAGLRGMKLLGKELAGCGFDMAILLQNAFEAAFIARMARIPIRAGYKTDGRGLLLTHGVKLKKGVKDVHQVYYYQEMLKGLGLVLGRNELFLQLSEDDDLWARTFVGDLGPGPIIGLNPGATYGPAKRWPAERYGRLAGLLHKEMDATVLIFGTEADHKIAASIMDVTPGRLIDLTGKTTLARAMALIDKCSCFVTNDSGLMHVAAALKTPLVAVFGSTNSVTTGPFSEQAVVIRKDLPCSPCLATHCKSDFKCMTGIEVGEVMAAVRGFVTVHQGY